jgi:histidine triad (HIT) family protein
MRSMASPEIDACVFCRILAGKKPADHLYRDDRTASFLDHHPLFPGHVLVVPREHHATLTGLPPELLEPLFSHARAVARAVVEALGADGSFIALNNTVSQTVPHLHVHVVPRHVGDGLKHFFRPRVNYRDDAHRVSVLDKLAAYLREHPP